MSTAQTINTDFAGDLTPLIDSYALHGDSSAVLAEYEPALMLHSSK